MTRLGKAAWLAVWIASAVAVGSEATAAEWLGFRGADRAGVVESTAAADTLPTQWSAGGEQPARNVAWSAPLVGRGVSGPIVVGGRVVVTASSGPRQDRLHVLCFDAASGAALWRRQFWATGRTLCHPTSAVAAPTPASDGQRIYAFFSSNDLVCLDLDGNLQWFRGLTFDYPRAANDIGMASSPVVVDGVVVVQVETKAESFAAGLDALTGETRWRIDRLAESNWASPAVALGPDGRASAVLLQSTDQISAHEPQSGRLLWSHLRTCAGIASPTVRGDLVYVPSQGVTVLRHASGATAPEIVWQSGQLEVGSPSPVVAGGRLYLINRAGVLTSADASTGEVKWKLRLSGNFWATPIVVGDLLVAVNQDGVAQVVRLGDAAGEKLAENVLGEGVLGSPAVVDGALYVRSDGHLWKIAAQR